MVYSDSPTYEKVGEMYWPVMPSCIEQRPISIRATTWIVDSYSIGHNVREIAAHSGISESTIRRTLQDFLL